MTPSSTSRRTILVTGSEGLIGTALVRTLSDAGFDARGFDLRARGDAHGDILDLDALSRRIEGCAGVVHLAAVSRVIDGERNADLCWRTNVEGTRHVLDAALRHGRPWVVYGSSREVYGQPPSLPAGEDTPIVPVNVYGRSKVEAERLVARADLPSAMLRFSNVYGVTADHLDRVVPAFARQAVEGLPLRVDGADHTFDFTHLSDTVRGIMAVVASLEAGRALPPIHLLTGVPTTLGELAALAVELAESSSLIREAPPRSYDVSSFYGDPSRAEALLDWRAEVPLRVGLARLIADFRARAAAPAVQP